MAPVFARLLPAARPHHLDGFRTACEWGEGAVGGVTEFYYSGSCMACVVALHAVAMRRPDEIFDSSEGPITAKDAVNSAILDFGLPLPLVDAKPRAGRDLVVVS